MSDKTESPALLSPERLAEIQEDSAVAIYWVQGQRYPTEDMGHRAVPAVYELLADRAAFRQMVAAELRLLLYDESIFPQIPPADRVSCMLRNNQVKNAAKALKIDLSAPTP